MANVIMLPYSPILHTILLYVTQLVNRLTKENSMLTLLEFRPQFNTILT